MVLHGTTGTQTAFTQRVMVRRSAQFNIAVDPASWTLAGLGMKVGTDVSDYRVSRSIGYWTGAGLSEDLPRNRNPQQGPPDRQELDALLENEPSSPWALQAAEWVIFNTPDGPEVEKAAEVIVKEHIYDTNLVILCQELERLRPRCSQKLLQAALDKNPSSEVRGNACFTMALFRKEECSYGLNQKAASAAEKLLERVIRDFGRVKRNGKNLADLAKPELADLRQLAIGKPAPETMGRDFEGHPIGLGDYRGNVVLLVFWGQCGGCRPEVPPLVELLDRLTGKPFAIVGVYCDDGPAKAKAIAEESGMVWPSIIDSRSGPVSTAWHNQAWPTFDVIDSKGIIRYRNVSEIRVSEAVHALVSE
ncbi:MAG: TlpA family protein disulfide reductase [Bryobacteraceae bacterium]